MKGGDGGYYGGYSNGGYGGGGGPPSYNKGGKGKGTGKGVGKKGGAGNSADDDRQTRIQLGITGLVVLFAAFCMLLIISCCHDEHDNNLEKKWLRENGGGAYSPRGTYPSDYLEVAYPTVGYRWMGSPAIEQATALLRGEEANVMSAAAMLMRKDAENRSAKEQTSKDMRDKVSMQLSELQGARDAAATAASAHAAAQANKPGVVAQGVGALTNAVGSIFSGLR